MTPRRLPVLAPVPPLAPPSGVRRKPMQLSLDFSSQDEELMGYDRPKTRGECEGQPRPCPWVGCRYHLALYVDENGEAHIERPDAIVEYVYQGPLRRNGSFFSDGQPRRILGDVCLEVMTATCALDMADRGGMKLERIGRHLGLTRERVRQLEMIAGAKLKRKLELRRPDLIPEGGSR